VSAPHGVAAPREEFQTSLVVGDGLNGPSGFEIAPNDRIFILERSGKIKIVKNGELLPTPFADLPSEDTGDRGLIGIAFDPDFGVSNHYVYFYYTGHDLLNHLVRFDASQDVGADGPFELFRTSSPSHLLHVGGSIRSDLTASSMSRWATTAMGRSRRTSAIRTGRSCESTTATRKRRYALTAGNCYETHPSSASLCVTVALPHGT
jgi:hypothetical protein